MSDGGALRTVLLVIDGLTAPDDPPLSILCPTLDRLSAVGSSGQLHPLPGDEGLSWRMLAPLQPEGRGGVPLGYLTALGLGLAPDPALSWACMDFAHLRQHQDRLIFVSPQRAGLSALERRSLAESMTEVLEDGGWHLHSVVDGQPLILSTPRSMVAAMTPLDRLEGGSLLDHHPKGQDGLSLLGLITNGQMVLARHNVNRKRLAANELPLNTPWIWGVASGDQWQCSRFTNEAAFWSTDATLCGLARGSGFARSELIGEVGGDGVLGLMDRVLLGERFVNGVIALPEPERLARWGRAAERLTWLKAMDADLLSPLSTALAADHGRLLVIGSGGRGNQGGGWAMAEGGKLVGKKRFWMRKSFGQGGG